MNKTRKRKTKKTNNLPSSELIGIILILLGLISFISIFSDKMGIIGDLLYKAFSYFSGGANFILSLLIIFVGFTLVIENLKENAKKYIFSSLILLICVLILFDVNKGQNLTLIERINLSSEYATVGKGGGIIGATFGFFMYKLFGTLGSYVLTSLIILGTLFWTFSFNLSHIKKTFNFISNKFQNFVTKLKIQREHNLVKKEAKKVKNEKSYEKNKVDLKDKKSNVILEDFTEVKINDFNDSNNNPEKISNLENNKIDKIEKISEDPVNKDIFEDNKAKENQLDEDSIDDEADFELIEEEKEYVFPPLELLNFSSDKNRENNDEILKNKKIIEETMANFGIESKITAINKGPTITCYELEPSPGVRLSKIVSLSDNLALSLASSDIRIEAPIPGKSVVGIEVPNKKKASVTLREMIDSNEFKNLESQLPLTLGKDVSGKNIISSIDKMPHLLIAGATGSGKSVCINGIITSIIYKSSPKDVRLVLIDPKVVELSIYNGIPHLLIPVVTNPKKAAYALNWAVDEMEKRYKAFAENAVRDIQGYNKKMLANDGEALPKIVVIVDELADLMMVASSEVEDYIARLAQMARAAGIYLIIATQRPSVDVITGTIKANIPSRIAFSVSSSVDSRTILDMGGAEKLLGKGDMLFYPGFYSKPKRIQGAFISDEEVERVIDFVRVNSEELEEDRNKVIEEIQKKKEIEKDRDPLFLSAVNYVLTDEQASISFLQRKLKVGYSRAARIVDQMEESGIIGPHEGSKPRTIILTNEEIEEFLKIYEK